MQFFGLDLAQHRIEFLENAELITDYVFKFAGFRNRVEDPLTCLRCEPVAHRKRPVPMPIQGPSMPAPMFCSSKLFQKMIDQPSYTRVGRSFIQGLGLFATKTLEQHELILEYVGLVIGHAVSEIFEKEHEAEQLGCYMFKMQDDEIVDSTKIGNNARFINHSCDPNCYAQIVNHNHESRVVIIAGRKINCGEELTYDYKFQFEEAKIPCNCGARNCRKVIN